MILNTNFPNSAQHSFWLLLNSGVLYALSEVPVQCSILSYISR